VELVDRHQVGRVEPLRVLARPRQDLEDALGDDRRGVVPPDAFGIDGRGRAQRFAVLRCGGASSATT
jgi:hypothetical protein